MPPPARAQLAQRALRRSPRRTRRRRRRPAGLSAAAKASGGRARGWAWAPSSPARSAPWWPAPAGCGGRGRLAGAAAGGASFGEGPAGALEVREPGAALRPAPGTPSGSAGSGLVVAAAGVDDARGGLAAARPADATAAKGAALDAEPPRAAVHYDDDQNYRWHRRILLAKLTKGAKWAGATPANSAQVTDLAAHQVAPLTRACPAPDWARGNALLFDPLPEDELSELQRQATALATLLGGAAPTPGGAQAQRVVADPSSDSFGQAVAAAAALDPKKFVQEGSAGRALIDDDGRAAVERGQTADLSAWLEEERPGAGRGPRAPAAKRDSRNRRFLSFREALAEMSPMVPNAVVSSI